MDTEGKKSQLDTRDITFIKALKSGDSTICRQFFFNEIAGILQRIRMELFHGRVDFDEMVSELYLFLSHNDWARFDNFNGKNGCRLRTWMIPVAWRHFMDIRRRLLYPEDNDDPGETRDKTNEDLRIQIAIDVNAVLSSMPNRRYSEIIRLLLIDGYTPKDVAEMLGMRIENVYNMKHRAITQFMEIYGQR